MKKLSLLLALALLLTLTACRKKEPETPAPPTPPEPVEEEPLRMEELTVEFPRNGLSTQQLADAVKCLSDLLDRVCTQAFVFQLKIRNRGICPYKG